MTNFDSVFHPEPVEGQITGSQSSGDPLASPQSEGLAAEPVAVVTKFVTAAPAADETDTARLQVQLADAKARGDKEVVALIGRVLFQKSVIRDMRCVIDARDQAVRFIINQHRATRRAA